jgi:GNAT superfamily N-acetyltransferase
MSLTPVAPGMLATVVTSLEMTTPPPPPASRAADSASAPLTLARLESPAPDDYRALFRRVGADWLWCSRLVLDDAEIDAIIGDPAVEIYAVRDATGTDIGMLELDFREGETAELAFFGLVAGHTGRGHGRWLMTRALALLWRPGVARVWLHSCTLDHPAAIGFYRASGFTPFARAVESFADPRLTGHLPRDAAPQVPIIA